MAQRQQQEEYVYSGDEHHHGDEHHDLLILRGESATDSQMTQSANTSTEGVKTHPYAGSQLSSHYSAPAHNVVDDHEADVMSAMSMVGGKERFAPISTATPSTVRTHEDPNSIKFDITKNLTKPLFSREGKRKFQQLGIVHTPASMSVTTEEMIHSKFGEITERIQKIEQTQSERFQHILEELSASRSQSSSPRKRTKRYLKTTTTRDGDSSSAEDEDDEGDDDGSEKEVGTPHVSIRRDGPSGTQGNLGAVPGDTPAPATTNDDDIDALIHGDGNEAPDTSAAILSELFPPPQDIKIGPKVHDNVAALLNKKWSEKLTQKDLEGMGDLVIPENLTQVTTPLLNKEVWSILSNADRRIDLRNIKMQQNIQRAAVTAARTADLLLKLETESNKGTIPKNTMYRQLLTENVNAVGVLGSTSSHMSFMRRYKMKSSLNTKISGICDLDYTGSQKLLFGDDFNDSVARADKSRKLKEAVKKPAPVKKQDFRQGGFKGKPPPTDKKSSKSNWWKNKPKSNKTYYQKKNTKKQNKTKQNKSDKDDDDKDD